MKWIKVGLDTVPPDGEREHNVDNNTKFETFIPGKVDPPPQKHVSLEAVIKGYSGRIDSDNRLHICCVCDGTAVFLANMIWALEQLKCTDIKADEKILDGIRVPKDKPWCKCLFKASGVLPKED